VTANVCPVYSIHANWVHDSWCTQVCHPKTQLSSC